MNTSYIGKISDKYTNRREADIFNQLREVTKGAYILFNDLKNKMNPTDNISYIYMDKKSINEMRMYKKRLKELKNVNIIKKANTWNKLKPIAEGSYMINPSYIMCMGDQERALLIWDSL